MPKDKGLKPKEKKFVENYAATGNGTWSARDAGYKSPAVASSRMLKKDNIKDYLTELQKKAEDAGISTIKDIKRFWTNVYNDPKVKMVDRLKASELFAKSEGAFFDRVENNTNISYTEALQEFVDEEEY